MKLHLQGHFLSEILGKKDIKIDHLGALGERLKHQKVLIIIDDLDDQVVLDTLVGQTQWFGYGSRIIVVTNDKHFLRAHGIDHIYEVSFPSEERAQEMLCRSAFKQNYPPEGFGKLVADVVTHAGNLPLGLNVLGSYLRDRDEEYWMHLLPTLQSVLDGKIGNTLRVSYDGLDREEDKIIFRHIACLFNYVEVKDIKLLLADSNLGVSIGLTNLVDKSLIHVIGDHVVMHRLLQEMGRKIVRTQSIDKPGEREFLVDPNDISYVLSEGIGTQKVLGISLDTSETDELHVHESAFKGMYNLRFLEFFSKNFRKEDILHLPESFDYLPPRLKLLCWLKYPVSCMPSNFCPENLVKLEMRFSKLHKLWEGVVSLPCLKEMNMEGSSSLKDIPDLSMATNLETLCLGSCESLVELPSSIRNLNKLLKLNMGFCRSLKILPTGFNLKSLEYLYFGHCSKLRTFPEFSTNISLLSLTYTYIEEFPSNLHLENLVTLVITEDKSDGKQWEGVKVQPSFTLLLAMLSPTLTELRLETIPSLVELPSSFQNLNQLKELFIIKCRNLETLPSGINFQSLHYLSFNGCSRLRSFPEISTSITYLDLVETGIEEVPFEKLSNLKKLIMSGEEVPSYFTHRTTGSSSLTIHVPLSQPFFRFRVGAVVTNLKGGVKMKVNCEFKGRYGNSSFDLSVFPYYTSHLHYMLIIQECRIPLNEDNAPLAKRNYDHVDMHITVTPFKWNDNTVELKGWGIRVLEECSLPENRLPHVCKSDEDNLVNKTEHTEECVETIVKRQREIGSDCRLSEGPLKKPRLCSASDPGHLEPQKKRKKEKKCRTGSMKGA